MYMSGNSELIITMHDRYKHKVITSNGINTCSAELISTTTYMQALTAL